ncbi:unnamed protein product [Ectocarpus sp. 12 AP-2014]
MMVHVVIFRTYRVPYTYPWYDPGTARKMLNVSPTTLLGQRRTTTHQVCCSSPVWVRWASPIFRGAAARPVVATVRFSHFELLSDYGSCNSRFSGDLYQAERNH